MLSLKLTTGDNDVSVLLISPNKIAAAVLNV